MSTWVELEIYTHKDNEEYEVAKITGKGLTKPTTTDLFLVNMANVIQISVADDDPNETDISLVNGDDIQAKIPCDRLKSIMVQAGEMLIMNT